MLKRRPPATALRRPGRGAGGRPRPRGGGPAAPSGDPPGPGPGRRPAARGVRRSQESRSTRSGPCLALHNAVPTSAWPSHR
ncbi:MAG: hypothetical protein DI596_09935 [Azospira oryzae]|nr:MAG: hypothetical protein DI596_09935 [Azospira oryzae]PZP78673.1 MAG: hypothetical protein DI593_09935 [Azospira oryzae]